MAHHLAKQTNAQPAGAEDTLPLFFLHSQFLFMNMALCGREYTSNLVQMFQLCPLPAPSRHRQSGKKKKLRYCASTVQQ